MSDAYNTQTSHAEMIPELWESQVILAATDHTANAFMANAVQMPVSTATRGDTYHFPIQSRVNMAAVTEGTALEYRQFSASEKTLTLNKNKGVVSPISSIAAALSKFDVLSGIARQAGMNAGANIDADLAALYASAGITVTGTTAANITAANIQSAVRQLDSAKAPRSGVGGSRRFLIVDPTQMQALTAISTFAHADRIGDGNAIRTGLVGMVYGLDVFMGHNVVSTTDGFKHCLAGVYTPNSPEMSSLVWAPAAQAPMKANVSYFDTPALGLRTTFQWDQKALSEAVGLNQIYGVTMVRTEWTADIKVTDN